MHAFGRNAFASRKRKLSCKMRFRATVYPSFSLSQVIKRVEDRCTSKQAKSEQRDNKKKGEREREREKGDLKKEGRGWKGRKTESEKRKGWGGEKKSKTTVRLHKPLANKSFNRISLAKRDNFHTELSRYPPVTKTGYLLHANDD